MSLQGTVELSGAHEPPGDRQYVTTRDPRPGNRLAWNVELGIGQGSIWLGIPLTGINGVVGLQGQYQDDNLLTSGQLSILDHCPSGNFNPIIDSYGRVIFTRWDHLQRDQQNVGGYCVETLFHISLT